MLTDSVVWEAQFIPAQETRKRLWGIVIAIRDLRDTLQAHAVRGCHCTRTQKTASAAWILSVWTSLVREDPQICDCNI